MSLPPRPPHNTAALEAALAEPDAATSEALRALDGDLIVLGAGGKMGPSLTRMAHRALMGTGRRVIAVSRFSQPAVAASLTADGITVVRADLDDPRAVAALPDAANVLWLAGQKFGTTNDPVGTWSHNVVASVHAAERYAGSRIVCFSTGNVYGRTPLAHGGSQETDSLVPDGEYAASCIGRERVFTAVAQRTGSPLLLNRLFYACDLRYGVVTDIALRVLAGTPVSLDPAAVNVIWQGDANRLALRALSCARPCVDTPAVALNITGPVVSVRDLAECVARHAGVPATFEGVEGPEALTANVDALACALPHEPLPLDTLCAWAVAWIRGKGQLLHKPTHYEVRDGRF
jgi:nucleoside-diphosphate-sugar epimerase